MKVLTGENYSQARLLGIIHEMWCERIGRQVNIGDTVYATGTITTNTNTGEIGLLIDENSEYFSLMPEVHQLRLVDVVESDGWNDVIETG